MLLAGRPDLPAATCPRRRQMSRSEAKELGDFIDPGQAGLVIVGESQVEDAIKHHVTRAEKQMAKELDVDPKNIGKTLHDRRTALRRRSPSARRHLSTSEMDTACPVRPLIR
jgi:hypothetical protein